MKIRLHDILDGEGRRSCNLRPCIGFRLAGFMFHWKGHVLDGPSEDILDRVRMRPVPDLLAGRSGIFSD
jgi:hypothetical protein